MADIHQGHSALGDVAARTLANATKTVPQLRLITPRWFTHMLNWVPVEAGIYRVNKVKDPNNITVDCSQREEEREFDTTFVDYEEWGREYYLSAVNTVVDIHTRVSDLYSSPHNQIHEQVRLAIEIVKERQERELLNNEEYGLLRNVDNSMKIKARIGPPTPDDMDELIARVWKEPAFFLAHPAAIAAFGRECTRRGVPPPTISLFGSQFLTWRGFPLIPTDKIDVVRGQDRHPAAAHRGKPPGRGRAISAGTDGRTGHGPVGALHGHQPQGNFVLPDFALLLAGGSHRRCRRNDRKCRGG